ncbi:hypothetical protein [Actinoplanes teichomyceticus]|uniref:hypothetical protein n=1 Tax=Actinoplanes teichomyceticus TaxID=1867 RepID=UPI000F0A79C6|nr:hypothetical protein [Actinoplanes teichomyceticus]
MSACAAAAIDGGRSDGGVTWRRGSGLPGPPDELAVPGAGAPEAGAGCAATACGEAGPCGKRGAAAGAGLVRALANPEKDVVWLGPAVCPG